MIALSGTDRERHDRLRMERFILAHEPAIRLGAFATVLFAMAAWEALAPRRALSQPRMARWPGNIGVVVIDTLLVRALLPTAVVGLAAWCAQNGWGLLNILALPAWARFLAAFVALDLVIWAQHVTFHVVPPLWRLHRVHHADLDFDLTTGLRFHPLEILLSLAVKLAAVAALGAPPAAVIAFEVALSATSLFNHGNVRLPAALDRTLRWIVVTPDMHRVHHSVVRAETDSNFGFNLPWWDRLFGTYRPQPAAGHAGLTIGLDIFRDPAELRLDRLLLQPFVDPAGRNAVPDGTPAKGTP